MKRHAWILIAAWSGLSLSAQTRVELAGPWERWIGSRFHDVITVPSSYRPIGTARLRREIELAPLKPDQRMLLRFEGVAHRAEARVNGKSAGSMGPWTPYDFDVTDQVRAGRNQIEVEVTDWQVPLGPSGAWEASGGIIRDVHLETRSDPYIENAHLQYKLSAGLDTARCDLDVYVRSSAAAQGRLTAALMRGGTPVAQAARDIATEAGGSKISIGFEVASPLLWSPENPNLYTLRVRLRSANGEDLFTAETGFRDLAIHGNQFLLSGKPLVLRGVCRHDIWKDQGHTMTQAQIEQDLGMTKAMGANFIRLVHYPHNKRVVDTANRLGLFVTEESGLVWLDFRRQSRETIETGLGNLERTLRRDWNSPALFALLLSNESSPTLEVIQEARRRIRALAPDLFMSAARIDGPDRDFTSSKRLFDEGGLDFYTHHPYGYDMRMFEQTVEGYPGKPVVFTEWGGRSIGQSAVLMEATTEAIGKLVETGRLAGHSFWSWADLPEFSREGEEMVGGILTSGVVTEDRVPRADAYVGLMNLFRRAPRAPEPPSREAQILRPQTVPLSVSSRFTPVSLQKLVDDPAQAQAWSEMEGLLEQFWKVHRFTGRHWEETGRKFWTWNAPQLRLGKMLFETPVREGQTQPVVLTPNRPRVEISVGMPAQRFHFLGNVTLPDGYPVMGKLGNQVGRYVIVYQDGERQEVPLRWGEEVARSNMITIATRIDPATAQGERVIVYSKDPIREVHQTRLLSVDARGKTVARVICELAPAAEEGVPAPPDMHHVTGRNPGPAQQALVLFAITAEQRD